MRGSYELPEVLATIDKCWESFFAGYQALPNLTGKAEDGFWRRHKLGQESTGSVKDMGKIAKGTRSLS